MTSVREQLCLQVASLPLDCSVEHVQKELEPLLQQAVTQLQQQQPLGEISPLLVASDKGHVTCLEYFAQCHSRKGYEQVIGRPLDSCPAPNLGGNTAVHHAATSGCHTAMRLFHQMDRSCTFLALGSVTNNHHDTPLHMASKDGYLAFVQSWYELALQEEESTKNDTTNAILGIFQQPNDSQDTCLSLACCHGHLNLVQFLLETVGVIISHEEITTCQHAVSRIEQSIKVGCPVSDPEMLQSIQSRQTQVKQGFEVIEQAYANQVERMAQDLLLLRDGVDEEETTAKGKPKKKAKKKKKNKSSSNSRNNASEAQSTKTTVNKEQDDTLRLTTLSNGKLAIAVAGETLSEKDPSMAMVQPSTSRAIQPSPNDMLRQRWSGAGTSTTTTTTNGSSRNSEIDAVLDALCLDVSMLLYTPHGMALNLSPSQLEAVEQILSKQMAAVQQARAIQEDRKKHPKEAASLKTPEDG